MKSDWIRVGLESNDRCPYKGKAEGDLGAQRVTGERPCDDGGRDRGDVATAKEHLGPPEALVGAHCLAGDTSTCASICGGLVSAICCRGEPEKQGVCWALEFGAGSSPPRSAPTVRRPEAQLSRPDRATTISEVCGDRQARLCLPQLLLPGRFGSARHRRKRAPNP